MSVYLSKELYDSLMPGDMFESESILPGVTDEPVCFVYEEPLKPSGKLFGIYWHDLRIAVAEAGLDKTGGVTWKLTA